MVGRKKGSSRRTKAKDKLFFEALAEGRSAKESAELAGYSERSVHRYREEMDDFAEMWGKVVDVRLSIISEKVYELAIDGVTETKLVKNGKSQEITRVKKDSPQMVMFAARSAEAGTFNFQRKEITTKHEPDYESIDELDAQISEMLGDAIKRMSK